MIFMRNTIVVTSFLVATSAALAGGDHEHADDDLVVGITGAGQLAVEFDFSELIELPEISAGPLSGWGLDEPGMFSLEADEPDEDFFVLGAGSNVRLEVISFDPALLGWTQGFASTFQNPGDLFVLGSPDFDEHPFWQIDSTHPGFNAGQSVWNATARLIDAGSTGYAASEPFTLSFVPVPEPTSISLIGFAAAVALMRRRRSAAQC